MEIHVASLRITGYNAGTLHIPIDDESIIDLSGKYQMLRNMLKLMIHILASKLQLQILNLPVAVKNKLLLHVQPMIIIKQPFYLIY